eukprot:g45411.t1
MSGRDQPGPPPAKRARHEAKLISTNSPPGESQRSVFDAASEGNLEVVPVQQLVREGADVKQVGPQGRTALLFAVHSGHLEVVQWLVREGCNINHADHRGFTASFLRLGLDIWKWRNGW